MKKYPILQQAYQIDGFKKQGKQLIEQLSQHLYNTQLPGSKTTKWQDPDAELNYWQNYTFENIHQFVDDLLAHSIHLHNPKYMGHQVSVPAPISALTQVIIGLLNNGMAVYEMGQAATAIEKCVLDLFSSTVGYDKNSNGILTSGGTLANLTALLAARQAYRDHDAWQQGNPEKLAVLVSSLAHYSIDRAVRVMGMGHEGTILIPVNQQFSIDPESLADIYQQSIDAGFKVIAIVGCACATATGTYDDLQMMADFCQRNTLWFHVDAAHGGAAIFSQKHKSLLNGIHRADSIIMDTHKMMMTPALSTVVLYKSAAHGSQTFHQKAHYLFEDKGYEHQWFNSGLRTFECTKLMICLKFYILWQSHGVKIFEENVDCLYELGHEFSRLVSGNSHFELAIKPQTNIVCFRFIKNGCNQNQLNQLNKSIRQMLLEDGEFYIVQAVLNDTTYLRVTLMNPMKTVSHLQQLLDEIIYLVQERSL